MTRINGIGWMQANMLSKRNKAGFTLIEMLVVIAVIAVLLAILLPSLNKAKEMMKRLKCQANLKQIALAWHMYLNDYDGRFYQAINANSLYGGWKSITPAIEDVPRPLNSYLSLDEIPQSETEAEIFRCPTDKGDPSNSSGLPQYDIFGTSYQTNVWLIGQNQFGIQLPNQELLDGINRFLFNGPKIQDVASSSRVLLIGDFGWWNHFLPQFLPGYYWHDKTHHYSMGFLDGHTEFVRIRKGLYVTGDYCVLPFKGLFGLAKQVQIEEPD